MPRNSLPMSRRKFSIKSSSSRKTQRDVLEELREERDNFMQEKRSRQVNGRQICDCKKNFCVKGYCPCYKRGDFCQNCSCTVRQKECFNKDFDDPNIVTSLTKIEIAGAKFRRAQYRAAQQARQISCNCKVKGGEKAFKDRCVRGFCGCFSNGRDCSTLCHKGKTCKAQPEDVKAQVRQGLLGPNGAQRN